MMANGSAPGIGKSEADVIENSVLDTAGISLALVQNEFKSLTLKGVSVSETIRPKEETAVAAVVVEASRNRFSVLNGRRCQTIDGHRSCKRDDGNDSTLDGS